MKTYKAIMHFNKAGSSKGKPWTVHYRGTCYLVKGICCHELSMVSEWKPQKKNNPRAFFTVQAKFLIIQDNIAYLQ